MLHKRFSHVHAWAVLCLVVVFSKIYQHNLYIKTMYEYQRLGRQYAALEKTRNELLVALYEQQQPMKLMAECEAQGMVALVPDAVVATTYHAAMSFVGTGSTDQALASFGIQLLPPKESRDSSRL